MNKLIIQGAHKSIKGRIARINVVLVMLFLLAGLLAAPASGLSAAEQSAGTTAEWQAVIDAAKKEGVVVWYTAITPYAPIAQAFAVRYGITVQISRQSSGPLARLYLTQAEAKAVVADVMQAFVRQHIQKLPMQDISKSSLQAFFPHLQMFRRTLSQNIMCRQIRMLGP